MNNGFKRQLIFIAAIQGFLAFDGFFVLHIGNFSVSDKCAFTGCGVGAALVGTRPVVEILFLESEKACVPSVEEIIEEILEMV